MAKTMKKFRAAALNCDKHNKREKQLSHTRPELQPKDPKEWMWEAPDKKSVYLMRKQAEKEYQAAMEEAKYWTNFGGRNYSDQQVHDKVREGFEKKYRTKDQRRRVAVEGDFKAYSRTLSDRHGSTDIRDSKSNPQLQSFGDFHGCLYYS